MQTSTHSRRRARPPTAVATIPGIALGELVEVDAADGARVDYAGNPAGRPLAAASTVALTAADVGKTVALGFAGADPLRPIVLGTIWRPEEAAVEPATDGLARPARAGDVRPDRERLVIEADREITLRCGKASITLTRAGKILLRGAYLLSRSSGANRIKGGSVQIN